MCSSEAAARQHGNRTVAKARHPAFILPWHVFSWHHRCTAKPPMGTPAGSLIGLPAHSSTTGLVSPYRRRQLETTSGSAQRKWVREETGVPADVPTSAEEMGCAFPCFLVPLRLRLLLSVQCPPPKCSLHFKVPPATFLKMLKYEGSQRGDVHEWASKNSASQRATPSTCLRAPPILPAQNLPAHRATHSAGWAYCTAQHEAAQPHSARPNVAHPFHDA